MSHCKSTFDVDGETVGPGQSAREIDEYADLRGRAVGVDRQAPDLVGAGHRQVEVLLVRCENEAVWARHRVDQAVELTIDSQPIDAPSRVLHSGLALIGEIEIAVAGKHQIIDALPALAADLPIGRASCRERVCQYV